MVRSDHRDTFFERYNLGAYLPSTPRQAALKNTTPHADLTTIDANLEDKMQSAE